MCINDGIKKKKKNVEYNINLPFSKQFYGKMILKTVLGCCWVCKTDTPWDPLGGHKKWPENWETRTGVELEFTFWWSREKIS